MSAIICNKDSFLNLEVHRMLKDFEIFHRISENVDLLVALDVKPGDQQSH